MKNRNKIKEIFGLLSQAPNDRMRVEVLELLFTPTELAQLVARYDIIQNLVTASKTQRELALHLKLSIAKITRGSNELKRRSKEFRTFLSEFFTKVGAS